MQVIYDLECYPNCFLAGFKIPGEETVTIFEISERVNDAPPLWDYLKTLTEMIGFNCIHYDWPMLQAFLDGAHTFEALYAKNQEIFAQYGNNDHVIWTPRIPQIDLFRIWHFNNKARMTSLKTLEFNMRSANIEDLPFPPGTRLTSEQIDVLRFYNAHDIRETEKFFGHSKTEIEFRRGISTKAMNQSDGTIGKTFFIDKLQQRGVTLYNDRRQPRQTQRPAGVTLGDVIFPWIESDHPEVQNTIETLCETHVAGTKGTFAHNLALDDFQIHIGLGGIHGSVDRQHVTGGYILDLDVTSYYPSLAIQHRIFPEHLGETFCDVYQELFAERQTYEKNSVENKAIKLALNSVYGDSNNGYSPFFDPKYMLTITINGQLLLLKLAEALAACDGVRLIQINTDGVTINYHTAEQAAHVAAVVQWWQIYSRLTLEAVQYRQMWIRDVNNYCAQTMDGKTKLKGAYEHARSWWQNHSALVVPKVVEQHLLTGTPIAELLRAHTDPFDFMLRAKAPRGSRLQLADGTVLQATTRYYISTTGQSLTKHMPPLAKSTTGDERIIGIHCEGQAEILGGRKAYVCAACGNLEMIKADAVTHNDTIHGWKVTPCNTFDGVMPFDIDFRWYEMECKKLVIR